MTAPQPAAGHPIAAQRGAARAAPRYPVAVVLATLVILVYWQAGGHGFVNVDDNRYVTGNPVVLRGLTLDGVGWAFTTFEASNWHPLTWLSHMLDVTLFGPSAEWHHRVNVLYHLLNTELLFFVLWRMTGGPWQSAFVAALFGVHPLHVESVAWIAERKDVLSTLFWILTMGAYLRYVRRPGVARYLPVAMLFALGLMSKPMLVTLPFAFLLLDWWPLGRLALSGSAPDALWRTYGPTLQRLVLEKVPLFALSAVSCAITSLAQASSGAALPWEQIPFVSRISNALVSYVVYLGKTVWPSSLAVYYPHPATVHASIPAWQVAGSVVLLLGLSALALREARRQPYLAVGWLWYLGTLVPVIGLIQVGLQAHADRYTYVPLIGIFVAVAWGVPPLLSGRRFRGVILGAAAGASLAALAASAWVQAGYWRDSVKLFSRAVAVTDRNWPALNNLGSAYVGLGRHQQSLACFREALRIEPGNALIWNNLGVSYGQLAQYSQAIDSLREAVRLKPDYGQAWYNLGCYYNRLGWYREAIDHFREALRLAPAQPATWNNLGVSYVRLGLWQQAIGCFQETLRLDPDVAEARENLVAAESQLRRSP